MVPQIKIDAKEIDRLVAAFPTLHPRVASAMIGGINRGGAMAFTQVRREVSKTTGIPQKDLNRSKGLRERKARTGNISYEIVAAGRFTPLSYFAPVQRRGGVSARPWGERRIFRGTFLATMRGSGHVGVFKRVPGARRIKELWGPSVPRELLRGQVPRIFEDTMGREVPRLLIREVNRVLSSLNPRQ